jgi:hypothetical protein
MIQVVQGPPRSGKSYFAVNYLLKFVDYDDLYKEYILKDHVLVISNIEGLKIKHWSLEYCLDKKPLTEFFTIENFEAIQKATGKSHIIVMIDEAHEIFPSGMAKADEDKIYKMMAYHGHIGLDIILLTQGISAMSRLFNPLLEYFVDVVPRSKKLSGKFSYRYLDKTGKSLYPTPTKIKCKQKVFGAYKSFRVDETNKPKSAVMFWYCFILVCFVGGGCLFWWSLSSLGDKSASAADVAVKRLKTVKMVKNPRLSDDSLSGSGSEKNETPSVAWRWYDVEGVVHKDGKRTFLILGRIVPDGPNVRNFSQVNMMVEYRGLELKRKEDTATFRGGSTGAFATGAGIPAPDGSALGADGSPEPKVDVIAMPKNGKYYTTR